LPLLCRMLLPMGGTGQRPDVPKPGGPFPIRQSCLRAQMAPAGWSFDPQFGGDHPLNCRGTYKRQTPPRQKIQPHSVLLCIETNCVPCHECSKRPLSLFPRPNGAGPHRPTPVWQWPRARARRVPPILPLSPVPFPAKSCNCLATAKTRGVVASNLGTAVRG